MSMANSLELRVPFLDKEVFRVASRLPRRLRVNPKTPNMRCVKAAMRHLPPATAKKKKLGFPVPTRVWLREEKYYDCKGRIHRRNGKTVFPHGCAG